MTETIINFWQIIGTSSLAIVITMIGFWFTIGKNIVSKDEVISLIENYSPYIHDKQFIMERLNVNKENQIAFANALQRNTEVMNELKIQIATLGKTLEALEERIERA